MLLSRPQGLDGSLVVAPQRNRHEETKALDLRIRAFGRQKHGVERDSVVDEGETGDRGEERLAMMVGFALPVRDGGSDRPRLGKAIRAAERHILRPVAPRIVVDARIAEDLPLRCRAPERIAKPYAWIDLVVSRVAIEVQRQTEDIEPRPRRAFGPIRGGSITLFFSAHGLAGKTQ